MYQETRRIHSILEWMQKHVVYIKFIKHNTMNFEVIQWPEYTGSLAVNTSHLSMQ